MHTLNNVSRSDIEKLIDEYVPAHYTGSDFKENVRLRIFEGELYEKMFFNSDQPKPGDVFKIELYRFYKWAYEKAKEECQDRMNGGGL